MQVSYSTRNISKQKVSCPKKEKNSIKSQKVLEIIETAHQTDRHHTRNGA